MVHRSSRRRLRGRDHECMRETCHQAMLLRAWPGLYVVPESTRMQLLLHALGRLRRKKTSKRPKRVVGRRASNNRRCSKAERETLQACFAGKQRPHRDFEVRATGFNIGSSGLCRPRQRPKVLVLGNLHAPRAPSNARVKAWSTGSAASCGLFLGSGKLIVKSLQ